MAQCLKDTVDKEIVNNVHNFEWTKKYVTETAKSESYGKKGGPWCWKHLEDGFLGANIHYEDGMYVASEEEMKLAIQYVNGVIDTERSDHDTVMQEHEEAMNDPQLKGPHPGMARLAELEV